MLNSPIGWVGGKRLLRKKIIAMLPPHSDYIEVFGGAGWVLFGKEPTVSKAEVYNDVNEELVNFWRVIKCHPDDFLNVIHEYLRSRKLFDDFSKCPAYLLTGTLRAVRFYYLNKNSYANKGSSFTARKNTRPPSKEKIRSDIDAVFERLHRVTIECLPYQILFERYDSSDTLFYIDPPYLIPGIERCYDYYLMPAQHEDLSGHIKRLNGKFILSLNDSDATRQLYDGCNISVVETQYSMSTRAGKSLSKVQELLITNF